MLNYKGLPIIQIQSTAPQNQILSNVTGESHAREVQRQGCYVHMLPHFGSIVEAQQDLFSSFFFFFITSQVLKSSTYA